MSLTNFVRKSLLPLSTLAVVLGVSQPALATEVMCQGPFGTCTVSNDGFDEVDCTCEGSGFGSTGGDQYGGLTEDELMEICLDMLADCEQFGEEGIDTGTSDSGEPDTGEPDTGFDTGFDTGEGTTDDPDTGFDTGMDTATGDGDGDGDEFGEESASTGDGDGDTGDSGDGDGDTGDSGDGDGDSAGTGDGDGDSGEAGDGDGDSGEAGDSADGTPNEAGDGETETGGTTGSAAEDGGEGCACNVSNHAPGLGLMALSIIGLLGIRRREADK